MSIRVLEHGTVKFFNTTKGYGFLTLPNGEELFFHISDVHDIKNKNGQLHFIARRTDRIPRTGEQLFFVRSTNRRGEYAAPWAYTPMRKTLKMRRWFRVYVQYSTLGGGPEKPKLQWEGTDLDDPQLTQVWHPEYDRASFSHEDFDSKKWFEVFHKGEWRHCSDPRKSGKINLY